MIRFRQEDSAGGENPPTDIQSADGDPTGTPAVETPVAPAQGWTGPTQQEWQAQQEMILRMSAYFNEEPEEEQVELGPGAEDLSKFIDGRVNERLAPMVPLYEAATKERGDKILNEMHDKLEKELGKFDRKLAERAAQGFATEDPDPHSAVRKGVEYAIEVKKQVADEALAEYKASLKRGPHNPEPGFEGGGTGSPQKFKTYDEVTEYYASQNEV